MSEKKEVVNIMNSIRKKQNKFRTKIMSLALAMATVFGALPGTAFAQETDGMSDCHPAHDKNCGYIECVEGLPCGHYDEETDTYTCASVLNSGVSDDATTSSDADESYVCDHTDGCGYVEAVEGESCTHSCEICRPEEKSEAEPVVDEKASVTANTKVASGLLAEKGDTDIRTSTLYLSNYGEPSYDGGAWSDAVDNVSTYIVAGSANEGWTWTYDISSQKYTLKLENAKIEVANGSAIRFPAPTTYIVIDILLSGENTVSAGGGGSGDYELCGIYASGNQFLILPLMVVGR